MAINSGNEELVDSLQKFYLPVFTVSAMDFQKMIGNFPDDGGPTTFDTVCSYIPSKIPLPKLIFISIIYI